MATRRRKALRILSVAGVLASLSSATPYPVPANTMPTTEEAANKVVVEFCQAEFNLDAEKRFEVIKFTPGGEAEARERRSHGPAMIPGVMIFPQSDPLIVVTSYVARRVKVTKQGARAIVEYKTVARRGHGGVYARFVPHPVERDTVELHLIHTEGRWWILDPPLPRVSLDSMIASYKYEIGEYEARFKQYPETLERDKKHYLVAKDNLKFLESLRKHAQ